MSAFFKDRCRRRRSRERASVDVEIGLELSDAFRPWKEINKGNRLTTRTIYYLGMFGGFALAAVLITYKPDTR